SIGQVWDRAVGRLANDPATSQQQLAFVRLVRPLGLLDETVLLAVGNEFTKDYLESRVRQELTSALSAVLGVDARFAVTVDPALDRDGTPVGPEPSTRDDDRPPSRQDAVDGDDPFDHRDGRDFRFGGENPSYGDRSQGRTQPTRVAAVE